MVGPFVFFDHMGPVTFPAGIPKTVDVRPHPHIGLSTVTYLFEGEIMHRDSVGSEQAIRPGEVNWMTAGAASPIPNASRKRVPKAARCMASRHGWRCRKSRKKPIPPSSIMARLILPTYEDGGLWARLVVGKAFRRGSESENAFADVLCALGFEGRRTRADLPAEYPERAAYIATGSVEVDGQTYEAGHMLVFAPGETITVHRHHARNRDAAWRRAARRTLHRMEFRLLFERTHRTGQSRLACRADEISRPRQQGVHTAARRPATACAANVLGGPKAPR